MNTHVRYENTRGGAERVEFKQAAIGGLAPRGGLYWPTVFPQVNLEDLWGKGYIDIAAAIFEIFAPDISKRNMRRILEKTYTREVFGDERITPVDFFGPRLGRLRLSNGPTLSFKDVALQLAPNILEHILDEIDDMLNVVLATSGDTGSAAEYGVAGRNRLSVTVLSPEGRMSYEQRRQMYTMSAANVHNIRVRTTFDGCQALVKELFRDEEFKKLYRLGALNSINWCRIAAQVVYYFSGYLQAAKYPGERITFVIPSGNFGNALSAFVAKMLGLPIDIIIATNENDVLDEFFKTGIYRPRDEVKVTSSPSMDIQSASNFERFIYYILGCDGRRVAELWDDIKSTGKFDGRFMLASAQDMIRSGSASNEDVLRAIRFAHEHFEEIIDPHTACALAVALEQKTLSQTMIIVETALAAKFPETIQEAIGRRPPVHPAIARLEGLPERTAIIDPDLGQLKEFLKLHLKPIH